MRHEQPAGQAVVEFDVLLSPTYRVPVLYFCLADVPPEFSRDLDFVYRFVVAQNSLAELQATSVMGGISMQVGLNS